MNLVNVDADGGALTTIRQLCAQTLNDLSTHYHFLLFPESQPLSIRLSFFEDERIDSKVNCSLLPVVSIYSNLTQTPLNDNDMKRMRHETYLPLFQSPIQRFQVLIAVNKGNTAT